MRLRLSLLATLLYFAWTPPAHSQEVKDAADILPANVLASLELRQPGPLAREVAALFKDSILGNVPDSLAPLRKDAPILGRDRNEEMLITGSFLAPEMIREFGRIRGAAVALTGIDKKHGMPEFVVVVLPGDSNIPGFMTRMFLSSYSIGSGTAAPGRGIITETRGRFEPVDTVEGVKLYRMVWRTITYPAGRPGAPAEAPKTSRQIRENEPAVAMMPGALLLGTPSVVKDVIERIKGKSEAAALSSVKAYQEARRQLGDEPGLFAFGNPARVFPVIEELAGKQGQQHLEVVKELVNPKAFRAAAASLGLKEGSLTYRIRYTLDPDQKSPLLEVLPDKAVATELMHAAPREAVVFAAISNDKGDKRWQQLLELADKLSEKAHPDAPAPSRKVAELEEALKLKIGKDVLGRIADAALVVGNLGAIKEAAAAKPAGPFVPPVGVILRAAGEDDAKALIESVLPKLAAAMTGKEAGEPTKKEIGGQDIYTLATEGKAPFCYGRQGETIVLGADPKLVAAWLKNSTEKGGLAGNEKVAAAVKKLDEPVALAVVKPMVMAFYFLSEGKKVAAPDVAPNTAPDTPVPDRPLPEGPLPPRRAQQKPTVASEAAEGQAGLSKIIEAAKDNFLVIGLMRKPDHVQLEARVTGLRKLVPALIDLSIIEYQRARPATGIKKPDFGHGTKESGRTNELPPRPQDRPPDQPPAPEKPPR